MISIFGLISPPPIPSLTIVTASILVYLTPPLARAPPPSFCFFIIHPFILTARLAAALTTTYITYTRIATYTRSNSHTYQSIYFTKLYQKNSTKKWMLVFKVYDFGCMLFKNLISKIVFFLFFFRFFIIFDNIGYAITKL